MVTVGSEASPPLTVTVAVAVLPASSWAVTVTTFVPSWMGIPLAVQLVVPVAVPLPPRLLTHVNFVSASLWHAVPPTVRGGVVVLQVEREVGEVMWTVGGM